MTISKLFPDNPPDESPANGLAWRSGVARPLRSTVLAYHELEPEAVAYQYALPCRQFEDHLRLASLLKSESAACEEPLTISFDDGHISHYESALPLLEKYSCKGIFFVIVGRISERNDFMTWSHLEELIALGHRVEAHGWSHAFLTSCTDAELQNEVKGAKEMIEDRLGAAVSALSAPHGRWNGRVLGACEEAGYRQLYTSNPWTSRRSGRNVEVIGRLVAVQSMNVERLLHWLTMGNSEAGLRRAKENLKESARYLLGDKLYYQMWSRFSKWSGPEDYASETQGKRAG
jgi:peptidoglycan/xylan/chitin deacetylase (PgdA/CDA1 family)